MACIEGLSWGMDISSVERHLGVSLSPVKEEASRGIYEVNDFKMSGIPVNSLRVRIEDDILITAQGYCNLTAALPVTVAAIEALMA